MSNEDHLVYTYNEIIELKKKIGIEKLMDVFAENFITITNVPINVDLNKLINPTIPYQNKNNCFSQLANIKKELQIINTKACDQEWRIFKEWQRVMPDVPYETYIPEAITKRSERENIKLNPDSLIDLRAQQSA